MKFLSFFKVIMAYLFCQMSLLKHHLSTKGNGFKVFYKSTIQKRTLESGFLGSAKADVCNGTFFSNVPIS